MKVDGHLHGQGRLRGVNGQILKVNREGTQNGCGTVVVAVPNSVLELAGVGTGQLASLPQTLGQREEETLTSELQHVAL